jgi:hypothetical protein
MDHLLIAACILTISLHEALIGSPVLAQEGTLVRAEYNDCTILQVHFVVEDCDDLSDGLIHGGGRARNLLNIRLVNGLSSMGNIANVPMIVLNDVFADAFDSKGPRALVTAILVCTRVANTALLSIVRART